jgi:hypothetical protein
VTTPPPLTWDQALTRLETWATAHGHARVPQRYAEPDGFRLGKWVHNQRTAYRARFDLSQPHFLSDKRTDRLETVPGWTWNSRWPTLEPGTSLKAPARPASPRRFLTGHQFDEQVLPAVALRALNRWLKARQEQGRTEPFTEEDVRTDPHYQALHSDEMLRASLAALVATGSTLAKDGEGRPLGWEEIVTAPEVAASWTFQSAAGHPGAQPIPGAVLVRYQEVSEQDWRDAS